MAISADKESDRFGSTPHPRDTLQLLGQLPAERLLLDAYRSGRLPQAIILGGPAGIGKATLAWRMARFLLENPRLGSAAVCSATDLSVGADSKAASQLTSLAHPDLVLLRRETNEKTKRLYSEIRADDVRRAIGLFHSAAGAGGYRICIVDSAEDLNRSSANALLKIIEEPPPASLFLLVAHRPGLVLPTIRSRARLLMLEALSAEDIAQVVATLGSPWAELEAQAVADAARAAQGSVHDALRLLDGHWLDLRQRLKRLLDRLPSIDWPEVHRVADKVSARDGGEAYEMTLTTIYDWLAHVVRQAKDARPSGVARYAEVWEKIAQSARETDALNLDKRPLMLSIFSDLASAARVAPA